MDAMLRGCLTLICLSGGAASLIALLFGRRPRNRPRLKAARRRIANTPLPPELRSHSPTCLDGGDYRPPLSNPLS